MAVMAAGRSTGRFVVWRHGSKKSPGNPTASMRSRFLALRVRPANRNTIRQPWDRISEMMVRQLLAQINGDGPATVILPTELIIRESA